MPKQILYFLIFIFLFCSSCVKPLRDRITGKWQLSRVSVETLGASELKAYIEFTKEGKIIFKIDSAISECKWDLSRDEKSIILYDNKDKKIWNIISISNNELIYTEGEDSTKITLIKQIK